MLTTPESSHACSCPALTLEEAFREAGHIFLGEHVGSRSLGYRGGTGWADVMELEFRVKMVWKGEIAETIYVWGEGGGGGMSCGKSSWPHDRRGTIVYAGHNLDVYLCTRAVAYGDAAEDLALLGEGRVPRPGTTAYHAPSRRHLTPAPSGLDETIEPERGLVLDERGVPTSSDDSPEQTSASSGSCGRGNDAVDLTGAAMLFGLGWYAVKRKRPGE